MVSAHSTGQGLPLDLPRSYYGLLDLPGRRHGRQKSQLRREHQGGCESTAGPSGYPDGDHLLPAGLRGLDSGGWMGGSLQRLRFSNLEKFEVVIWG